MSDSEALPAVSRRGAQVGKAHRAQIAGELVLLEHPVRIRSSQSGVVSGAARDGAARSIRHPFAAWTPPALEGHFRSAFGSSVLEEFVAAHSPSDVLRELVANTYDAAGSRLEVRFGAAGVSVTNNGDVIDRTGWKRLQLLMGTGRVIGGGGRVGAVPPK